MNDFEHFITLDGSVGLYNSDFDDIYHSVDGALTEAYEKFVYPVNYELLMHKDNIKVLDICYGIGYNTKSFLNFLFFENKFKKKNLEKILHAIKGIVTIHTDNNQRKLNLNDDTIYTYNTLPKIYIKAVDNDEVLFSLSAFIKSGLKVKDHEILKHYYKNVDKKAKNISKKKIQKLINFLIFDKICQKSPEILKNNELFRLLSDKKYDYILSKDLKGILRYELNNRLKTDSKKQNIFNLHNIYYKYITKWYKWRMKTYNLQEIDFTPIVGNARDVIKLDKNIYNLIFLDAFTPSKCPCLWSYEFIKLLYDHLDEDGLLLTYSSAVSVRSAMLSAGFYIGYIYNKRLNKYVGTIASKNKNLIKYPLSEYDLGLLNTKAGIFYRDKNLNGLNEAIIALREKEVENSSKMSTSEYKKIYG